MYVRLVEDAKRDHIVQNKSALAVRPELTRFFNPPISRCFFQGAKSGTIGPTPLDTEIANLADRNLELSYRALDLNACGILCYANKLDYKAAEFFRQAIKIEEGLQSDDDIKSEYGWMSMNLRGCSWNSQPYFSCEFSEAPQMVLEHREAIDGYKRNLALVVRNIPNEGVTPSADSMQ